MNGQKNINQHFISLIISLSGAAWQSLGKIPNPITNKIEKNVENAKMSIDMLEMIKEKTKGNLTDEEQKLLNNAIADLQLNYVDELKTATTENKANTMKKTEEKKKETSEEVKKEATATENTEKKEKKTETTQDTNKK